MKKDVIVHYITEVCSKHNLSLQRCHWVMLEMSRDGWKKARSKTPKFTGLYIHLSEKGYPLRIGIALGKEGIYGRWFSAVSCHQRSFTQHRDAPLNLRKFFQQIQIHYPKTYILCIEMASDSARTAEKILCSELAPIWETRDFNGIYVWRETKSFLKHPSITFPETEMFRRSI